MLRFLCILTYNLRGGQCNLPKSKYKKTIVFFIFPKISGFAQRERVATVSHGYLLPQHEGKIVFSLPRGGRVTTDGGTPVRPISGCGWIWSPIGGEIKESKMVAKPGRWREEGEEIREMAKSEAISGRQTGCKCCLVGK